MNDTKDITNDSRFTFPVPGVLFLHRGQEIDLRKITEARAMQLAADDNCKFIQMAAAAPKAPAAPAANDKGGK